MSPWVVAALFAIGVSGWLYPKINARSGYTLSGQAMIATGIIAFVLFLTFGFLMSSLTS